MIEDSQLETYLYISKNKFEICLFDKKISSNLYKEKLKFENSFNNLEINILEKFIEDNIFKIEKMIGKFVKNIIVIIVNNKILNLNLGINKKIYGESIDKTYVENILTESKDLFKESYQDYKLMHMIVKNYLVNGNNYSSFINNLKGNQISLEVQFICIPNELIYILEKILEKFQIKIIRYLSDDYIKNFFKDANFELAKMASEIKSGCNENEITLVPKNIKNLRFFERFFQLFS